MLPPGSHNRSGFVLTSKLHKRIASGICYPTFVPAITLCEFLFFRKLVQAIAMTGCDLSACTKPWKVQYETVKVIFQEFYAEVNH